MRYVSYACVIAILVLAFPAFAGDAPLISLGLGATDILANQGKSAFNIRLDYRSTLSLLPFFNEYFKIQPWVGIETTSRQSIWGGGGIQMEIPFGPHWVLTPNVGIGAYGVGNGKDLGSVFEVRSTFEGGYVFNNGSRLVASFSHMSNAGVAKHNPGAESAMISLQIPLTSLTGHQAR